MGDDIFPIAERDRERLGRYLECRSALMPPARELIEKALMDGWTASEIAGALVSLAAELFPYEDSGN
ncbi:hypothetical protein [Oricola thermophila]|uniref:Uncharacterized protein n=1 Tax=Oricola thermophila TaxID=2742145 RepID=A0A6N1VJ00_9HYPH|nr:hypothetical protein [Oricola thermophila]QKV19179.1 hypothetical protein HTY61_12290 [Oricola thermophila]